MARCNKYGFSIPVAVCANGAIGGGNSANLDVDISPPFAANTTSFTETNFGGGSFTRSGWHVPNTSFAGCQVVGSRMKVSTTSNDNEVRVEFEVDVDNCNSGSQLYNECGGPGEHTLTGSEVVPITLGPC